eukprot:3651353-Rhodomonas_salina.1
MSVAAVCTFVHITTHMFRCFRAVSSTTSSGKKRASTQATSSSTPGTTGSSTPGYFQPWTSQQYPGNLKKELSKWHRG